MSDQTKLPSAPAEPDADADLVRALKARQPESYELLLRRYQRPVFSYVCRLLDDQADAEDLTQDVFVKVFRRIDGFQGASAFKTWLYRIATNEASNKRRWFLRHRAREVTESSLRAPVPGFLESFRSEAATPFEHASSRERRDTLVSALRALDPRFREAVVLRDIEGFSYAEIAETLGVPLGTVKSRILRGREALKRHLLRHAPSIAPQEARLQWE